MLNQEVGVCGFGFVVDPAGTLLQANFIQYVLYGSGQWHYARLKWSLRPQRHSLGWSRDSICKVRACLKSERVMHVHKQQVYAFVYSVMASSPSNWRLFVPREGN